MSSFFKQPTLAEIADIRPEFSSPWLEGKLNIICKQMELATDEGVEGSPLSLI